MHEVNEKTSTGGQVACDTFPSRPRHSTVKELLNQKAKRLRTEAARLESLSDSLPDRICAGQNNDEILAEIIAGGLYPRVTL